MYQLPSFFLRRIGDLTNFTHLLWLTISLDRVIQRAHSRPHRPRSFWSTPRIATTGRVKHRKSAILGLIGWEYETNTLRMLRKSVKGQRSRFLVLTKRIAASGTRMRMGFDLSNWHAPALPQHVFIRVFIFQLVKGNDLPACVESSMYFWTHTNWESASSEPSKRNSREAREITEVAKTFCVKGGVEPLKITVLCSYRGQASL